MGIVGAEMTERAAKEIIDGPLVGLGGRYVVVVVLAAAASDTPSGNVATKARIGFDLAICS